MGSKRFLLLAVALPFAQVDDGEAQTTNRWNAAVSGFWQTAGNWSAGLPTNSHAIIEITNATTKTVTINSATPAANLTISNLVVRGFGAGINTLQLTNAPAATLRVLSSLTLGTNAVLVVTNSAVQVDGLLGGNLDIDGIVSNRAAGVIATTNSEIYVGRTSPGQLFNHNGSILANNIAVAFVASAPGTLTISGGSCTLSNSLTIGVNAGGTGTVWVTGGLLNVPQLSTTIGSLGVGAMTVSNGTVLANNVVVSASANSRGALTIAGGTLAASGTLRVGGTTGTATGSVWITGGQLVITNAPASVGAGSGFVVDGSVTLTNGSSITVSNVPTVVGNSGSGSLMIHGGSMLVSNLVVANLAGSRGTITFAGGTNRTLRATSIALGAASTGTVWITGGLLQLTNTFVSAVGSVGSGELILSNGTLRSGPLTIGSSLGSAGTLTVAGGTVDGPAAILVGSSNGATGAVWVTGGTMVLTNINFNNVIGLSGIGRMTVSNGLVVARRLDVKPLGFGVGTLTVSGGTNAVDEGMTLGDFACAATGVVEVTGGRLFVTNATATAVLEVRNGSLTLSGGTLTIDQLVITNACGHFFKTGGTLSITSTNLAANLDADGDGLPNSWETGFGLSPFDDSGNNGANGDPDGDGVTNLQEYEMGTDPTNSASIAKDGYHMVNGTTTGGQGGPTITVTNSADFITYVGTNIAYNVGLSGSISSPTNINVASDKTIFGLGTNAMINGTLYLSGVSNVIVRNLFVTNPADENGNGIDDEDGLSVLDDSHHVWIDHCTFFDCADGELDITKGADFVTVSWCEFHYTFNSGHNFVNLIGHSDGNGAQDTGKLHVTFHHNWWSTLCVERMPRARFGRIHSYNNYFNAPGNNYCIRASISSEVFAVKNVFENVDEPFDYFAPDGKMLGVSNLFINCSNVISVSDPAFTPPYVYTLDDTNEVACLVTNSAGAGHIDPTANNWIDGSGKWEGAANWSLLRAPSTNDSANYITLGDSITVTIDAATANSSGTLTISNLVLAGSACATNTLLLSNAGTITRLRVLNSLTNGIGGIVSITNSTVQVDGLSGGAFVNDGSVILNTGAIVATNVVTKIGQTNGGSLTVNDGRMLLSTVLIGGTAGAQGTLTVAGGTNTLSSQLRIGESFSTGTVWVTGGQLATTNAATSLGVFNGVAQMTVSNGTWLASIVSVGVSSSQGTLTFAGGTNILSSEMRVSNDSNSTGTVWLTGGQLTVSNAISYVGYSGVGQMTVSNGTWQASTVDVGLNPGSRGTLTIVGGTSTLRGALQIGAFGGSAGTVWLTGGELAVTDSYTEVGYSGVGRMTVSNGAWRARYVIVAEQFNALGTLTIAGGTTSVSSNLTIGNFTCSATGLVTVAGGQLDVTNGSGTAVLEVLSGLVTLNSGTLTIDRLVITNACGHFVQTGGTLLIGTTDISPSLDADDDGIPNAFDLDPFNPANAGADPDGDGFTNLQEFQAGTDPTNSASAFRITAIAKESSDIRVTWTTAGGHTNRLQATNGGSGGSFTNNFVDIDAQIILPGSGDAVTNRLDAGGATNQPARYYRVRLVP